MIGIGFIVIKTTFLQSMKFPLRIFKTVRMTYFFVLFQVHVQEHIKENPVTVFKLH
jgi:hypothetical protein